MRRSVLMLVVLTVLPLLACNTRYLGEECAHSDDFCDSDLSCREDFPGGFCTRPCSPKGDAAGCPQDSLCIQQFNQLMCAPVCTSDTQCREGYECRGETGSSVRSCRVKPQPVGTPATP
jgi:hypothetical protein